MRLLVLDTATAATVVGVSDGDMVLERRHDPPPGERPGHMTEALGLIFAALDGAGLRIDQLDRIGVGVGPGSFTGLRIGLATARALAQATAVALVGVSSLRALAAGAGEPERPLLALLDARRGEAFCAAWAGGEQLLAPIAAGPEALAALVAALPAPPLALGDGALRFRAALEAAGALVPADDSPRHRVGAEGLCRLAAAAAVPAPGAVLPDYVRAPDARPTVERT